VCGRGGHGALPHQTVDALLAAAHLVVALQTIVSRNVDPIQTAVLSVGTLHSGEAFNIIAERAELTGTIRAFDDQVMALLVERLRRVVSGVAATFGATYELELEHASPAVVNAPEVTELVARAARRVLGEDTVGPGQPVMGSEDMAEFLARVPGCYCLLGSQNPDRGLVYPHHNPRFDFDEEALPLGVAILVGATMEYLGTMAA